MNHLDLHDLPAVIDLATAAAVLDIGRTSAYQLVRTGTWPTPVLRLGNRIRIPTAPLLALVGVDPKERVGTGDPQAEPDRAAVHRFDSDSPPAVAVR